MWPLVFEKLLFSPKMQKPALVPNYSHYNGEKKNAQIRWKDVKVPAAFQKIAALAQPEGQNKAGWSFSHGIG